MGKENGDKRVAPLGWKGIVFSILFNLAFLIGAAIMFAGYFRDIEMQKIVDNGVTAEAEITAFIDGRDGHRPQTSSRDRWVYKYTDDDGILYQGTMNAPDPDQFRIGEKIDIYIGISKESIPMCRPVSWGNDVNAESNFIWVGLFLLPVLIYFILLTIYLLWWYDKLPSKKKEKDFLGSGER